MDLYQQIADIIVDFRRGEIEPRTSVMVSNFTDNVQRVCSNWMRTAERQLFLEGLRDAFQQHYWSELRTKAELSRITPQLVGKYGDKTLAVLKLQEQKSSQANLIGELSSGEVPRPIFVSVPEGYECLLYIDDASFTGRTLVRHLESIFVQTKNSPKRPSQLLIWHLCEYSQDAVKSLDENRKRLVDLGIKVTFIQVNKFLHSANGDRSPGALVPSKKYATEPYVLRFLKSTSAFQSIAKSPSLWRDPENKFTDEVFKSVDQRDIIEHAFLEVGCWLRAKTPNWNSLMRPFGFVSNNKEESLGFGSMFCTYHNSANTSPLALWWGDPKAKGTGLSHWDPLLPRRPQ